MLFKWSLIEQIVAGQKTQTRRPVGASDIRLIVDMLPTVYTNKRIKWQVGRSYAVQYGRGLPTVVWDWEKKKALPYTNYQDLMNIENGLPFFELGLCPLRIKLTDIRYEDVRNISHEDSLAEGFNAPSIYDFLHTWISFYDAPMKKKMEDLRDRHKHHDFMPLFLWERPDNLYQAWALSFEVVLP